VSRGVIFVDPASGTRNGDSFAAAHAVQQGDLSVLVGLRIWNPPFSPASVTTECCEWVKRAGLTEVTGDRWATGVVPEMFRSHGVVYHLSEMDKSALYLALLPLINALKVKLLDHPELLRQLRGLERRRGWSGKDRVDHRRGQHDDLANAAAGAIVLCAQGATYVPARLWMSGDPPSDPDAEVREWAAEREVDHQDLLDRIRRGGGAYLPGIDG
jgi:hypothetical protein